MYDALIIVQLGSGQLSHGTAKGTQARFDALLNGCTFDAKLVWSSPKIQTKMGAKDVLFQIDDLNSCLHDTLAYYSEMELIKGFTMTCAFEPRVIKQSCGSEGEGIWLCWQWDKASTTKVAIVPITQYIHDSLDDGGYLTMMEMSDNHVDFHAVRECITFCIRDYDASSTSVWTSSFAGKYLEDGKAAGSKLIDQRLPPRIIEATHVASTLRCRGGGGQSTHTKPYCEDALDASVAEAGKALFLLAAPPSSAPLGSSPSEELTPPPPPEPEPDSPICVGLEGHLLYVMLAEDYPTLVGKITGMHLEYAARQTSRIIFSGHTTHMRVRVCAGLAPNTCARSSAVSCAVRPPCRRRCRCCARRATRVR